jgi:hypothetical protein
MPTEEGEDPNSSLSAALKKLFFRLQYSPTPVSAKELMDSFGWQTADALQQHDVQEFEIMFFDRLEQRMKGVQRWHLIIRSHSARASLHRIAGIACPFGAGMSCTIKPHLNQFGVVLLFQLLGHLKVVNDVLVEQGQSWIEPLMISSRERCDLSTDA